MKYSLVTLLFTLFLHQAVPQNRAIDSINILIANAKTDTGRINLVTKKILIFGEVNIDSALELSKQNLEASIKVKYPKGEADSRTKMATNYCFKGEYNAALENLKVADKIYMQLNDSMGLLSLNLAYGLLYGMQSQYDRSIIFFKRSVIYAERLHETSKLNTAYQNIATSYQMQSNYAQALIYYQRALRSAEKENDISTQAYINLNIGITFKAIGDTLKSEQSLLKSIALAKRAEIKNVELYAYSNLATVYSDKYDYDKAYMYAMKASVLGKETGDIGMEASGLSKAGTMLAAQKKFLEAEPLITKAILIADSSKQPLNIYQTNVDMGSLLKDQNKYRQAIPFYEKAFSVMQSSDLYDEQVGTAYNNLSKCYEKTGDYNKALNTYKISAQINDSIRSKENVRKATELNMNYEFDKKRQIAAAQQQKKDEVSKTKQTALIIGLVFTFFLAGLAFYAFRNKRQANHLLSRQKEEIQSALSELKSTQAQLIQSEKMASLGELTAGIAHEIQNPLNFVNNFSEVNNELIDEMNEELNKGDIDEAKIISNDIKQNLQKIHHHGKRADAIVKGMLQHSRTSTEQKEFTDINALCDEYLRLSYHGLRAKQNSFNATLQTNFDESIGKINIVPQDMGRVFLNLFNNAFYAVGEKKKQQGENYKPTVSVSTKKINNKIEICVKDNGNGIPDNVVAKIFQPFFTTKPTGQGTGLGLSLSYDIVTKVHGGEIKVQTIHEEGTEFIILLPV